MPAHKGRPHLFERLCDRGQLDRAWSEVLAHYRKSSVPPDLQAFDRYRGREIERLAGELRRRQFLPQPVSLIYIPKPSKPGEQREIALVKPDDRIVLTALNRILEPMFERHFLEHCYAYRRGRSALGAVERVEHCLRHGLEYTASADIDNFFGTIDRGRMLALVKRFVWEQPIVDLVETYLHMGATAATDWVDTGKGIAQGSPLSPLLSNVYLLGFDYFLKDLGVEWVRYGDNFIMLARVPEKVTGAMNQAEAYLATTCLLELNEGSRLIASWKDGFDFLGFWFEDGRRMMNPQRLDQKKIALSEMFRRQRGNLKALVEGVADTALGWRQYYGSCTGTAQQMELLQSHLFDLLVPWLQQYRREGAGRQTKSAELKATLLEIELPKDAEPARKVKWVELALARSRPEPSRSAAPVSAQARQAIEKRKREFRRKKEDLEEILITERGTYLGRTGERLLVRREGKREREVPLTMIRNITVLTTAVSMSGEIMAEAAARGIPIHLLGHDGKPLVRIGPPDAPSFRLSAAQVRIAETVDGLRLAACFIAGKVRNQANLLRYYGKYKGRRGSEAFAAALDRALAEMKSIEDNVQQRTFGEDHDLERNRLFASEGQAASAYWGVVKALLWQNLGFTGRVRRGVKGGVKIDHRGGGKTDQFMWI